MSSYFEVETPSGAPGWTTLAALASDRAVLAAKVAATRSALGAVEVRVAGSIDFLGVAARVLSPALRSAVVGRTVPVLAPDAVWWRPAQPGPMRVAMHLGAGRPASAAALLAEAVRPTMTPLVAAYRAAFALSPRVLWGNVASALSGAAGSLRGADELVRDVLTLGELATTALVPPPHFVRNSCCLYYRTAAGGVCGDCVLLHRRSD